MMISPAQGAPEPMAAIDAAAAKGGGDFDPSTTDLIARAFPDV